MKILIVDDDVLNRMVLNKLLNFKNVENHYHTFEATNGLEAVALCEEMNFDLIFMDIRMPKMDGFEASRLIRKGGSSTPIAMITSECGKTVQQQALSAGANEVHEKPITKDLVKGIIQRLVLDPN